MISFKDDLGEATINGQIAAHFRPRDYSINLKSHTAYFRTDDGYGLSQNVSNVMKSNEGSSQ